MGVGMVTKRGISMKITLGFSTCPNDTFMFDAMVHGRIDTEGYEFEFLMEDILHLNRRVMDGALDMVKISYNTFGRVMGDYALLPAGSALGHNCGPLLISKDPITVAELVEKNLPVAIPGQYTTANLLLGYYAPAMENKVEMLFDEVMPAVQSGACAAGLIIHENRFTYQKEGLKLIQDLGEHWESKTGLPIPLGAIVARKSLGPEVVAALGRIMRRSVEYAFAHPETSLPFVREHAQEMEDEVMQAHIKLYVNSFSTDLGEQGQAAVKRLLEQGEAAGLYPTGTAAGL